MTDEEKFLFDLQGYLVVENVLTPEQVQRMRADMDANGIASPDRESIKYRFGGFLAWGDDWRSLIDHPRILPHLVALLGEKFRLDHAYGMAGRVEGDLAGQTLHHHAGMFGHGCYYVTHGQTIHNGLIVVSFALSDIRPGAGGFCCIPGSHKALFKMPDRYYQVSDNPLVRQVSQKAGDVVIFTEALTHGTMPWSDRNQERRSVLLKYCPLYMQWGQGPMPADIAGLTDRQRQILQGAYVWQRPSLAGYREPLREAN